MKQLMTTPNLVMAGVVLLGGYAAYRLIKAKREDVSPEGSDDGLVLLGDPLQLTQNRFYRGRLRVRETGAAPFLSSSDRNTLTGALGVLGFNDVQIYMNASELPGDWPRSTIKNAGPLTRWFQGQWKLPTATLPRPPDVEAIWMAKPPGNAQYIASAPKVSGIPAPSFRTQLKPLRLVPDDMTLDNAYEREKALGWWGVR